MNNLAIFTHTPPQTHTHKLIYTHTYKRNDEDTSLDHKRTTFNNHLIRKTFVGIRPQCNNADKPPKMTKPVEYIFLQIALLARLIQFPSHGARWLLDLKIFLFLYSLNMIIGIHKLISVFYLRFTDQFINSNKLLSLNSYPDNIPFSQNDFWFG